MEEMRNNDIVEFLCYIVYEGVGPTNSFCTYRSNGMFSMYLVRISLMANGKWVRSYAVCRATARKKEDIPIEGKNV